MASSTFISWICHFWARFWLNFNFGDFRAYFSHFSLVKIDFFKIHFHPSKKIFGKNKNHPQFLYHINQWKNTRQFDFGTFCYFQPYLLYKSIRHSFFSRLCWGKFSDTHCTSPSDTRFWVYAGVCTILHTIKHSLYKSMRHETSFWSGVDNLG